MQEQAVRVVHPGFFDEDEEEVWNEDEKEDVEQNKKEYEECDGVKNDKDVQKEEEENIQDVVTNENSETKMRLRKVASVYGVTPALISKIWQLMRLTPS